MRKLLVFNNVTLDGYFTGLNGDMRWAHKTKQDAFVAENSPDGGDSGSSWQGKDDVGRHGKEAGPAAYKDAKLRQWECLAVL